MHVCVKLCVMCVCVLCDVCVMCVWCVCDVCVVCVVCVCVHECVCVCGERDLIGSNCAIQCNLDLFSITTILWQWCSLAKPFVNVVWP